MIITAKTPVLGEKEVVAGTRTANSFYNSIAGAHRRFMRLNRIRTGRGGIHSRLYDKVSHPETKIKSAMDEALEACRALAPDAEGVSPRDKIEILHTIRGLLGSNEECVKTLDAAYDSVKEMPDVTNRWKAAELMAAKGHLLMYLADFSQKNGESTEHIYDRKASITCYKKAAACYAAANEAYVLAGSHYEYVKGGYEVVGKHAAVPLADYAAQASQIRADTALLEASACHLKSQELEALANPPLSEKH
ncbi:Uncharacterised protein [Candidatus Burarchaeum australiense]|nr:Uncharacterised protein [Candidatus Burarchaeum australiense]